MNLRILEEAGYTSAMYGLALSYNTNKKEAALHQIAVTLASKDGGHNKFLESMMIWVEVNAPLYWWTQADTYRISTKQSESTMHTLMKTPITKRMFEYAISTEYVDMLESIRVSGDISLLKSMLPCGFKQTRVWCLSYKTLRNIILQRRKHKLCEWQLFCYNMMENVNYPKLLGVD